MSGSPNRRGTSAGQGQTRRRRGRGGRGGGRVAEGGNVGAAPAAGSAEAKQLKTALYKTEMCRPFCVTGVCKYGDACQFAHGLGELRAPRNKVGRHLAERCRAFWEDGYCPFGTRCRYRHDETPAFAVVEVDGAPRMEAAPLRPGPRSSMMMVDAASPALPTVSLKLSLPQKEVVPPMPTMEAVPPSSPIARKDRGKSRGESVDDAKSWRDTE